MPDLKQLAVSATEKMTEKTGTAIVSAVGGSAGVASALDLVTTVSGVVGIVCAAIVGVMGVLIHRKKMRNLDIEYDFKKAQIKDFKEHGKGI